MDQRIATITAKQHNKKLPQLRSGDVIKVMQKVKEGGKERLQPFEGTIISIKHGTGIEGMMTVRAKYGKHYVERIYPIHSPKLASIEVLRHSKARRAKLYYLRERTGKKASMRRIDLTDEEMNANEALSKLEDEVEEEAVVEEVAPGADEQTAEGADAPAEEKTEEALKEEAAPEEPVASEAPADDTRAEDEKPEEKKKEAK